MFFNTNEHEAEFPCHELFTSKAVILKKIATTTTAAALSEIKK
jgi:hypothetical protein